LAVAALRRNGAWNTAERAKYFKVTATCSRAKMSFTRVTTGAAQIFVCDMLSISREFRWLIRHSGQTEADG